MELYSSIYTLASANCNKMRINIKQMLEKRSRSGKVPRLLLWYLRRLFHEDFLNRFFEKGYTGLEFCSKAIDYIGITLQVEGEIPDGGPYTFVSNHPILITYS